MKDSEIYLERMKGSFTSEEKLFFLDRVGLLSNYAAIIDFGCADGTMLKCIDDRIKEEQQNKIPELIGIELNLELKNRYFNQTGWKCRHRLYSCITHPGLTEFLKDSEKPILLILSSVLHEIDDETYWDILDFIYKHNVVVVARDMAFDWECAEDRKVIDSIIAALPKELKEKWVQVEDTYEKDFRTIALYEFFLKYTYSENWETEVKESYFNNTILHMSNYLKTLDYESVFEHLYILPYKKEQVKKDFGYELRFPTHYQCILRRKR